VNSAEAFVEFIRLHGDKAYNFAFRLAGNEADAQDLVQEAFAKAFKHRDRYDPEKPFESWLYRILQNIYLDGVRRLSHRRTVSLDAPPACEDSSWEEVLPGADADPIDGMLREETDAMIQRALGSLPIHYRTAVTLGDIEGLSYEGIGRVMGCPVGTVRSRIHQGRVMLRKAFHEFQKAGGVHGTP
jgi:RNA polymerase sigma-70 factor, ECF subfamily